MRRIFQLGNCSKGNMLPNISTSISISLHKDVVKSKLLVQKKAYPKTLRERPQLLQGTETLIRRQTNVLLAVRVAIYIDRSRDYSTSTVVSSYSQGYRTLQHCSVYYIKSKNEHLMWWTDTRQMHLFFHICPLICGNTLLVKSVENSWASIHISREIFLSSI